MKDGFTWNIHWMDWNEAFAISPLNEYKDNFVHDEDFTQFFNNLEKGTLPNYTFLIPRIFWDPTVPDEEKP